MSDKMPETPTLGPYPPASPMQNLLAAAKGGSIIFSSSLFSYGVRSVLGIVLARSLGPEQFGLYNLSLTTIAIASGLSLLGMKTAMVRYVSLYLSRRDERGVWGTIQVGVGLTAAISIFLGISLYLGAELIAQQLFHDPRLAPLLRLVSLVVPFLTLVDILAATTRGFKKMQYTAIATDMSQPVMKLLLTVALLVTGLTAAKALVAHNVSVIIAFVLLVYFLNGLFPLKRPLTAIGRETKEMLAFSLPIYFGYLIQTFRGNIQTILLGAMQTVASVGLFTVAAQVESVSDMFHQSIATSSMPIISELHAQGDREGMGRFYQTLTKWTFALNLPFFMTVVSFPATILSIFGDDYVGGALALTILAWGALINTATGICGVVITMTGNTRLSFVNSLVATVLTVSLSALLIPRWGVVGVATASLVAASTINLLRLLEVFFLFRLLPYDASFLKPILAGLAAFLVAWFIRQALHTETSLVYAAMNAAILFAVYGGMILLLGLSEEDRAVLTRVARRANVKWLRRGNHKGV